MHPLHEYLARELAECPDSRRIVVLYDPRRRWYRSTTASCRWPTKPTSAPPLFCGRERMSTKVLSDVVPQNDIRAPQELASRRILAPRSRWGGRFPGGRAPRPGRRAIGPHRPLADLAARCRRAVCQRAAPGSAGAVPARCHPRSDRLTAPGVGPAIFNGGQHIQDTTSQLIRDRLRYMNVHAERHGQLEKPPSLQPDEEW